MKSTALCSSAVVLMLVVPALAQAPPDPKPAVDAVSKLSFLEGRWSGEGWMQMGRSNRQEFTQLEKVELKLDGAILLIEGIGHSKGDSPEKIHHALALVSYDPAAKTLRFSSYMAGRPKLDVIPEVGQNSFIWGYSPPDGGQIRYSIKVENGTWHEVGEYSRDSQSWLQFFEMTLRKD